MDKYKKVLSDLEKDARMKIEVKYDVHKNVSNKLYELDEGFVDDFCTENYQNEKRTKRNKKINIKKRNFKSKKISSSLKKTIISFAIIGSTLASATGALVSYNRGFENGQEDMVQSILTDTLRQYNLNDAPSILIDKWADCEIDSFEKAADRANNEGNFVPKDNYESIVKNEYADVKRNYSNYLETGNEEYNKAMREAAKTFLKKINSLCPNNNFEFEKSKLAYAIMVDPEGNIITSETMDSNLEIYELVGYDTSNIIKNGEIKYGDAVYKKYDNNEIVQEFSLRK